MVEVIEHSAISTKQDERGIVIAFAPQAIHNLHAATMRPGAVRGNHTHDRDEILCILGGRQLCQITVEDNQTGNSETIRVEAEMMTYRFKAGVKHTVRNTGAREFYLLSFLTDGEY